MRRIGLLVTCTSVFIIWFCLDSWVYAQKSDWTQEKVDWRIGGGMRIRNLEHPAAKRPHILTKDEKPGLPQRKKITSVRAQQQGAIEASVMAGVIDSPPVNGFVPWIAVSMTDAHIIDDTTFMATPESTVSGNFFVGNSVRQYAIGIFDTGASAHVIGYHSADVLNLGSDFISPSITTISGVTGSVDAWVSMPLGLFIADLGAIAPNGDLDTTKLVGQSNVAVAVGQGDAGLPDLATAIGSPMSVFYTTSFNNDQLVTVTVPDGNEYTAPGMHIYEKTDPAIPAYPNMIPLELRPLGATSVQYVPSMDIGIDLQFYPQTPSIITGNSSQSLFFVASVDLVNGSHSAIDKTRFMLDTGAQLSVIGSRVASRLGLNPAAAEFQVDIEGVTGDVIQAPGFYIDQIDIPALGDWLSFTNVPVVLLDIPSPEGGTLDGIIGMNLLASTNFVLHGGGFMLEADPSLEYELITMSGDISGDGKVDYKDLAVFAQCWLTTSATSNWNADCDMSPSGGDQKIDFADFAVMAENWL